VERRYQVFVSSTFLDLQEERAAVVSALLQLDAIPAGMELFPAADDDAWTLIERVIEASDYYLLVIGGKYGSVDPDSSLSFTEKEFDLAVKLKKPVMAFLHGEPAEIPLKKSETSEDTRQKLTEFRSKVEASKHVKFWTSPEDLSGKVALTYANFRQTYPAVGWVRGDVQVASEALVELNELRKRLQESEAQIEAARSGPPPGAERFASGSATFVMKPTTVARADILDEDYPRRWAGLYEVRPTWDEIFSAVGPTLLDEAHQSNMRATLNGFLRKRFTEQLRADLRSSSESEGRIVGQFGESKFTVGDDDFGTIVIQLRALGLINRSERKRSVADKETYWTLTPFGDEQLTRLRAITVDPQATDEVRGPDGA
jgi:hypothetical protein